MPDEAQERSSPQDGRLQSEDAASSGGALLTVRESIALLVTLLILIFAPAAAVLWTAKELEVSSRSFRPEVLLPVILLIGLISLMAILFIGVALYRRFQLQDRESALGLPAGSIQAIIALGLILIFAIVGVYLHGVAGEPAIRFSTGLTRAELDALPEDTIVTINTRTDGRFDVQRAVTNEAQDDLGQQLLTTVSTLVVAVAGFYFGSKAVGQGPATVGTRNRRRREDENGEGAEGAGGGGDGDGDGAATHGEDSSTTGATVADAGAAVEIPEEAPEPSDSEHPMPEPRRRGEGPDPGGGAV